MNSFSELRPKGAKSLCVSFPWVHSGNPRGPAASQSSRLKLGAGAEGHVKLILETAMDFDGPILSPIPPPSALEPVRDDMGAGAASILPDNSATYLGPYSHPNVQLSF